MTSLAVGVVGAGPWASILHAPMLAAGPETELAGVWARRPGAAAEVTAKHGGQVFARYEDLLDACEAVAFAVPPDVQATMALTAAAAGKALLLEKPLALDLDGAERLADAVGEHGVGSAMVLTWRYAPQVREFIDAARAMAPVGGRAWFLSGALLGGWFSTPWRLQWGALPDTGPHVVDLLDAALGRIVGVRAHGDSLRWVGLLLEHEGGAVSEASLSGSIDPEGRRAGCEVFTADATEVIDCNQLRPDAVDVLRAEFAAHARDPRPHDLDVQRGLHLQRILADAQAQL